MKRDIAIKLFICFFTLSLCLYSYLEAHNQMTRLRLEIPKLAKELRNIQEENLQLKYEIESFESPEHLIALAKSDQYSHLKFPQMQDVLTVAEGKDLYQEPSLLIQETVRPNVVLGAK